MSLWEKRSGGGGVSPALGPFPAEEALSTAPAACLGRLAVLASPVWQAEKAVSHVQGAAGKTTCYERALIPTGQKWVSESLLPPVPGFGVGWAPPTQAWKTPRHSKPEAAEGTGCGWPRGSTFPFGQAALLPPK